jgi:hypothetical protein
MNLHKSNLHHLQQDITNISNIMDKHTIINTTHKYIVSCIDNRFKHYKLNDFYKDKAQMYKNAIILMIINHSCDKLAYHEFIKCVNDTFYLLSNTTNNQKYENKEENDEIKKYFYEVLLFINGKEIRDGIEEYYSTTCPKIFMCTRDHICQLITKLIITNKNEKECKDYWTETQTCLLLLRKTFITHERSTIIDCDKFVEDYITNYVSVTKDKYVKCVTYLLNKLPFNKSIKHHVKIFSDFGKLYMIDNLIHETCIELEKQNQLDDIENIDLTDHDKKMEDLTLFFLSTKIHTMICSMYFGCCIKLLCDCIKISESMNELVISKNNDVNYNFAHEITICFAILKKTFVNYLRNNKETPSDGEKFHDDFMTNYNSSTKEKYINCVMRFLSQMSFDELNRLERIQHDNWSINNNKNLENHRLKLNLVEDYIHDTCIQFEEENKLDDVENIDFVTLYKNIYESIDENTQIESHIYEKYLQKQ